MCFKQLTSLLVGLGLLLSGGGVFGEEVPGESAAAKPTLHDRIYFFEHRLLPRWTHQTGGVFFDDLMGGKTDKILAAATEVVGPEFSNGIEFRVKPKMRCKYEKA